MKERISITIEKGIIRQVDSTVDGYKVKNRSHAIELLLSKAMRLNVPSKAVILAGGEGTRLRPLTYEIPKALLPIQGRTMTEHLFDLLKKYDIRDIILSIGHLGDKIKEYYGNGEAFGIHVTYVEENAPLGTAGPLRLCKPHLRGSFIVSNGDELKDINVPEMYKFHKQNKAAATIALTTVEDPSAYGVARLSGNRILEFVEKPPRDKAPSNLINSGFYILEEEVIDLIKDGFTMLEKDIFPKLAQQGKLFGYPFSGQWLNTGNMELYERAIKEWRGVSKDDT